MEKKYLTDIEVADYFGLSRGSVWRHTAAGILPAPIKLGHSTRWVRSELEAAGAALADARPAVDQADQDAA
jgi:predicted DNA-binding transcriptional regulator AlpA